MKRVVLVVLGFLLLVVGMAGIGLSGFLYSTFGLEGRYDVKVANAGTTSAALYVSSFNLEQSTLPSEYVNVTLSAANTSGKDLFIGLGPTSAVQPYLAGVPYEAASDLRDGVFTLSTVPGTKPAATSPAEQTFWVADDTGNPATITWPGEGGNVLMVMNADGSPGVQAELTAAMQSDQVTMAIYVAGGVGILLVMLAVVLLVLGFRRKRQTGQG